MRYEYHTTSEWEKIFEPDSYVDVFIFQREIEEISPYEIVRHQTMIT